MSDTIRGHILTVLLALREHGPVFRDCGICHHVLETVDYGSRGVYKLALLRLFAKWPEYSGDDMYPIRSSQGYSGRAYDHCFDKWDIEQDGWKGSYAQARWNLLQHCIETLQAGMCHDAV